MSIACNRCGQLTRLLDPAQARRKAEDTQWPEPDSEPSRRRVEGEIRDDIGNCESDNDQRTERQRPAGVIPYLDEPHVVVSMCIVRFTCIVCGGSSYLFVEDWAFGVPG